MEPWMRPMLCGRSVEIDEADPTLEIAEPKMDGWRAIAHVTGWLNHVELYGGRNGTSYTGQVPYLEQALAAALPPDTCVDGELLSATGWNGVQGAMTRHGCHDDSIYIVVFDILRVSGQDVRSLAWHERRRLVEAIKTNERVKVSPLIPATPDGLEAALITGFEGLVLKRKSSRYVNARSGLWTKVKPQQTAEARITGFKPGQGSFAGMVGALEFEMIDPPHAHSRCSGFDMKLRAEITAHPEQWLGQMIEIKHHGIGKEGKPRHPQYLRRRDDRTAHAAPATPNRKVATVSSYRMRNYSAMGDSKLLRCVDELANQTGDAFDKCLAKGGDPFEDLTVARSEAQSRGL